MTVAERDATPTPSLNRRVKSWPGWVLLLLVAVAFLVVGATRSSGPQSQEDRVDDVTRRIACPVCDGESVFVSQNNASRALRNQVEDLVRANELSDDEILAVIDSRNEAELLLVPRSSGLDALVWVLPAVGFVVGGTGLALAFRRWRLEAAGIGDPTDEDRALVDAALAADEIDDDPVVNAWPEPVDITAGGADASVDGLDDASAGGLDSERADDASDNSRDNEGADDDGADGAPESSLGTQ